MDKVLAILIIFIIGCTQPNTENLMNETENVSVNKKQEKKVHLECETISNPQSFSFENNISKIVLITSTQNNSCTRIGELYPNSEILDTSNSFQFGIDGFTSYLELDVFQADTLKNIIKKFDRDNFFVEPNGRGNWGDKQHTFFFLGENDTVVGYIQLFLSKFINHSSPGELRLTCPEQYFQLKRLISNCNK